MTETGPNMDQAIPQQVTDIVLPKEQKKYTGMAARTQKLLIAGCLPAQAAKALGISEGMVSQWMAEEDFYAQVSEGIKKDLERNEAIDSNYGNIEKMLSDKLLTLVPYMIQPDQVLRTLKFVNDAKRKLDVRVPGEQTAGGVGANNGSAVRLQLPQIVAQTVIINPQNEVVSVGNRDLVTLNSASMETFVATRRPTPKPALLGESTKLKHESKDPWSDL